MTTITTRTFIAAALSIMAASSNAAALHEHVGQYTDAQGHIGSYVQWTDDVAVTAGQRLGDDALYQSPCLDIQFFRHQGTPVQWATAQTGDKVSAAGNTTRRAVPAGSAIVVPAPVEVITTAVQGDITGRVGTNAECHIEYQVMDQHIMPGMAGGPVFNADNQAVGIIKGTVDYEGTSGSLVVPYAAIQQAWDALPD